MAKVDARSSRFISKSLDVDETSEGRVDLLLRRLGDFSRAQIRGIFAEGCVRINNVQSRNPGQAVKAGDRIELCYDPKKKYKEPKRAFQSDVFKVCYEDNHLLVVEKKAGYLTVPTEANESDTLIGEVNKYAEIKGGRAAYLVHRLDRGTSGLLVLAKSPNLAQTLKAQFQTRKPEREYTAIIAGRFGRSSGTFRSYLATDENLNQYSTKNEKDGKLAVTHYSVEKRFTNATLMKVTLETGRRNQIRVHFAESGHPVIGDERYKPKKAAHPAWPYPRLALHAAVLGFRHPVTKRKLRFTAALPEEFAAFLRKLEEIQD